MTRSIRVLFGVAVFAFAFSAAAFADTSPTVVSVQGPVANAVSSTVPISQIGSTAYQVQQTTFRVVSGLAGALGVKTSNSYVNVQVGTATFPVHPYSVGN